MKRVTGGCVCGDVRIAAEGNPLRVGTCHCLDCRKHHGALFYASAIFAHDAVQVQGNPHNYKGRYFCHRCGSSVFAQTGDEIELHLGSLDAPDQFKPSYECWSTRRENWLPPISDAEQYKKDREELDENARQKRCV